MGTCYTPSGRFNVTKAWRLFLELWRELIGLESPPVLDRWLSHRLGKPGPESKEERLWVGRRLDEIFRFAIWIAKFRTKNKITEDHSWGELSKASTYSLVSLAIMRAKLSAHREDWAQPERDAYPQEINDLLRKKEVIVIPDASSDLKTRMTWHSFPQKLRVYVKRRIQVSGWDDTQARRFLAQHDRRSPLWLRINRMEKWDDIFADLEKANWKLWDEKGERINSETKVVPNQAIVAQGPGGIQERKIWKEGIAEVQDLSTQAIGKSLGIELHPLKIKKGFYVWDACAGAGGKSLQIATALENMGAIYASDLKEQRLDSLRRRASRAGFNNIRSFMSDATSQKLEFGSQYKKRGGFDLILVDAPCSGSGTWRKNSENKLSFKIEELEAYTELQKELVKNAWNYLKPGGILVYATCSFFVEENEDIIEKVLPDLAGAVVESQEMLGNPLADCDTAFAARIRKSV